MAMGSRKDALKKEIRFLQNFVKFNGKKARVHYSKGSYTAASGLPQGTITIYAKDYGNQLPATLMPSNDTDFMTDYFDKDRARVKPKSKYYKAVEAALMKQEAFNKKLMLKRKQKYGW